MVKVKDTESFIRRAREIHGDLYDYSETVYAGSSKPVTIICKVCSQKVVLASANSHTSSHFSGCGKCRHAEYMNRKRIERPCGKCGTKIKGGQYCDGCKQKKVKRLTFEERCQKSFGERYGYSESGYTGPLNEIRVTCRFHGSFVIKSAISHYGRRKKQCPKCEMMAKRLHAEACKKASRQRTLKKECEWTRWADRKVCILLNRLLQNKNAETQLPIKFDSWEHWVKIRRAGSLRSAESRWQRKCRNWQRGLVRRSRQGRSCLT